MTGDRAAAADAYDAFFAAWHDADQDLPVILQARREMERMAAVQPQ